MWQNRSGRGRVVIKLLACRARGQGFNSRSCHLSFRDWLSPASSHDMAEILLKRRKSSIQPTMWQNSLSVWKAPLVWAVILKLVLGINSFAANVTTFYRHQGDWREVSFIDRCLFNRGLFMHEMLIWDLTKCPLDRGVCEDRFYCTFIYIHSVVFFKVFLFSIAKILEIHKIS